MNRIQRGRGGWVGERGRLIRATGIALVIIGLAIGGCSSKQKNAGEGNGLNKPNQLGENGLGPGGEGSLKGFQNGTMGQNGPLGDIHFDYNDATIRPQDN